MAAKRGFRVRLSTPNTGCLSGRPRRGSTKGGLVVLRRVGDHIRGHVVGYIALFVALSGGVAYAQLGRTITSSEIKNDTIRAADLNYPVGGDARYDQQGSRSHRLLPNDLAHDALGQ
jgi:hypothetical protein